MTGTIAKLLTDRRCGFIRSGDRIHKDYFFHHSGLKNVRYEKLKEGDEVTFEDVETERGPRAEDIYV